MAEVTLCQFRDTGFRTLAALWSQLWSKCGCCVTTMPGEVPVYGQTLSRGRQTTAQDPNLAHPPASELRMIFTFLGGRGRGLKE
jgi:hypothetical protein